jgi:DNA (cytosine-5)-methyltransferase 1
VADPLRHVDLCSGIGGFALGFQWAGLSRPVLFCDIEAWSRQVLAKHWPDVPIAEDVKERPSWCVFENVSGHISLGLDQVLSDLEGENYAIQPFVVPACAVDAPHRRDRVWIIAAHADSDGEPDGTINAESGCWQLGASDVGHAYSSDICRHDKTAQQGWRQQGLAAGCQDVADAYSERLQGQWSESVRVGQKQCDAGDSRRRLTKSSVGGMADGLSTWLDEPRDIPRVATGVKQRAARLKGLGNAIVPQIAMQIGLTIKAVEHG